MNVLIALIDPLHIAHDGAHAWFSRVGSVSWATCLITENGVLRIVAHSKYPNSAGSPAAVAPIVAGMRAMPGHVFWADELSLLASDLVDVDQITTPGQITDSYLLALAVANDGRLATFDRRLTPKAVRHGRAGLCIIAGAA